MNSKKFKLDAYLLFSLCWIVYMSSYVARYSFSTCLNDMVSGGLFDLVFGGSIATGFFIVYGSGQLINGIIGDRINPKYMIFTGSLGAGIATFLMGYTTSGAYALVVWCINGFFQAMLWAPIIRCCSEYIIEEHRKIVVNLALTFPIGMIISYQIARLCLKYLSWQYVFFCCGTVIALSSVIFAFGIRYLRNYIEIAKDMNSGIKSGGDPEQSARRKSYGILKLFAITGLFYALGAIICNGIIKEGINTWIPTYMSESFRIDSSASANIISILPFVNIFGAYFASFLNRRVLKNELYTSGALYLISFISLILLYVFGSVNIILSAILFSVSTAAMIGINTMCLTYIPMNFCSVGKASSVTGILDAFAYLAAAGSGVLTGLLAERFSWNGVILFWLCVSFLGIAVCGAGKHFWNKGKLFLNKQ